jgi:hypothetical protein
LSDIGDSSKSDFHDQKDDVLLFDTGDDSDVVTLIICGKTWAITSDIKKFLLE